MLIGEVLVVKTEVSHQGFTLLKTSVRDSPPPPPMRHAGEVYTGNLFQSSGLRPTRCLITSAVPKKSVERDSSWKTVGSSRLGPLFLLFNGNVYTSCPGDALWRLGRMLCVPDRMHVLVQFSKHRA